MPLKIILGDITKSRTTAIVNAANTSLLGGGGVDGAIHRAAGPELLAECRLLNGCKTGKAKLTKGYRLNAKYVIHTPGPYYSDGKHQEKELLESCYRSSLNLAVQHHIYDISFPSISTGIYRFPLKEAAETAVRTIYEYPWMDVTMVCFDEKTKEAYEAAKREYENRTGSSHDIQIEYCNLPMRLAFQNRELEEAAAPLLKETGRSIEILRQSDRSFRQMATLEEETSITKQTCEKIYVLMADQDRKNPYPLTRLHPFLREDTWSFDRKAVSYFKVDIRYGERICLYAEKIGYVYCEKRKCSVLCFYPGDDISGIPLDMVNGLQCLCVRPDTQNRLLEMVKDIMLNGTLDLCQYGFDRPGIVK